MTGTNLDVIMGDVYSLEESFTSCLSDSQLAFKREAEFAMQVFRSNDYATKIGVQNRQSVADAVMNVANIGISLNPAKKLAYLVPRDGKVCLDISYMGLIHIATQSGSILWAQAKLVHEHDDFMLDGIDRQPQHRYNPFSRDHGEVIGAYVVVKTPDGDYLTHAMSIQDIHAIRDRSSAWRAYAADNKKKCPWVTDEAEMVRKTVVKQAYKYWPRTDRLDRAVHYLNTDGNEGIELYGGGQAVGGQRTGVDVDAMLSSIGECESKEALTEIWKKYVAECRAKKDDVAYDVLKDAVIARGAWINDNNPVAEQ